MKISLLLLLSGLFLVGNLSAQIYCSATDSTKWESLRVLKQETPVKTWEKVTAALLNTPYVANTLEITEDTALVINFMGLDCVTFIETTISTVRTLHLSENKDFTAYSKNLEDLRYRAGKLQGYASRLHYTSEWMEANAQKGLGTLVKGVNFEPKEFKLDFMSTHAESYPMLANSNHLAAIQEMEKRISPDLFFLPKEKISLSENDLHHGDMIGIVTRIKGLDIAHTGFIYKKNGVSYLLHASSANKKVEISAMSLSDYLKKSKSQTGIVVFRWLNAF
jgi:hypothetical protein